MTSRSVDYWMTRPLRRSSFKAGRKGRSGKITSTIYTGFRLIPEMVSLINTLKANGIDVYICSASQEDVVEGAACNPKYGLNVPAATAAASTAPPIVIASCSFLSKDQHRPDIEYQRLEQRPARVAILRSVGEPQLARIVS